MADSYNFWDNGIAKVELRTNMENMDKGIFKVESPKTSLLVNRAGFIKKSFVCVKHGTSSYHFYNQSRDTHSTSSDT